MLKFLFSTKLVWGLAKLKRFGSIIALKLVLCRMEEYYGKGMNNRRPNLEEEIISVADFENKRKDKNIFSSELLPEDKIRIRKCLDQLLDNCRKCFYEINCPVALPYKRERI